MLDKTALFDCLDQKTINYTKKYMSLTKLPLEDCIAEAMEEWGACFARYRIETIQKKLKKASAAS